MRKYLLTCILLFLVALGQSSDVGYRITNVTNYQPLRRSGRSVLYQVNAEGVQDGRPLKLLELVGSHYKVGYDYAVLLSDEIVYTYNTFMKAVLPKRWELIVMELFLDWQFSSYVSKNMHSEFKEELLGLKDGGRVSGIPSIYKYVQRTLVISSYPGDIMGDIKYALLNEFIRAFTPRQLHQSAAMELLNQNKEYFLSWEREFMKEKRIQCSFFAVWGNRTENGKVFTMRNLDWEANTGVNQNKVVFVWKVDGEIAHVTLGFPGVIGALMGMSAAGLTVHEAGLDSHKENELGHQWTLRLRYIMAKAKNLVDAEAIWRNTNNTLGMNHMVGSGNVYDEKLPALVFETMAGYTAYFRDHDKREDNTTFTDPTTKAKYVAGFSMPHVVFRTNHGYDPTIRRHLVTPMPEFNSSTMTRYLLLKDGFKWYEGTRPMNEADAINMTAIPADKGSKNFKVCPDSNVGTNVLSVTFVPEDLKMWAAFEYGYGKDFRPACCGVYVEMDMKLWFKA